MRPAACPEISYPFNGARDGVCHAQAPVNSVCRFRCNEGFRLLGAAIAVCQANGMWSATIPECRPAEAEAGEGFAESGCTGLVPPLNGVYYGECSPGIPGRRCEYRCNPGFALIGSRFLTCLPEGRWSTAAPMCARANGARISCQYPRFMPGLILTACSILPGGRCYYRCGSGYDYEVGFDGLGAMSGTSERHYRMASTSARAVRQRPQMRPAMSTANRYYGYGLDRYAQCNANGQWNAPISCRRFGLTSAYPMLPNYAIG